MEKRYLVFVGSAFGNGTEERRAALSALLDLNCCPQGADLYDLDRAGQWPAIEGLVEQSDYVFLIVGGPADPAALEAQEREHACALQKGKPVIALLQTGGEPEAAWAAFREKLQQGNCRYWSTAEELGGAVSRSCSQLIHSQPAEGWVRGRHAKTEEDYRQSAQLAEEVLVLEREVARLRADAPAGAANLAQADEPVELKYSLRGDRAVFHIRATWNEVFSVVAMKAIELPTAEEVAGEVSGWIGEQYNSLDVEVTEQSMRKIKIQFFTLGLIEIRVLPQGRVWALTPAGRALLGQLRGQKTGGATA